MTTVNVQVATRPARLRNLRLWSLLALFVATVLGYFAFRGQDVLAHSEDAPAFHFFNGVRDWVDDNRDTSAVFLFLINEIRLGISLFVEGVQAALTFLGWMGVITLMGGLAALRAGWRISVLTVAGFASFGALGLWQDSMDTLALTLVAVALSLLVGIPLGIFAGCNRRARAVLTPVLDVMQVMPAFAYLVPMALIFLIGAPSAAIATMIYAIPPAIRITALGIGQVSPTSVEAATSLGATRWQLLRTVQIPMARQTIVLGINQAIMMALSMVVITALIDAPGLGQPIMQALERVNVGAAFDAGLAIVIMAIVLDRLTSGAGQRTSLAAQSPNRQVILGVVVASTAFAVVAGRLLPLGAEFPTWARLSFAAPVNAFVAWAESTLYPVTDGVKEVLTAGLLNPLQEMLTSSPWWLVTFFVFAIGLLASGARAAVIAAVALAAIAALGLWQHGMETLATVLVAGVLTMAIGLILGVAAARRERFAVVLRPLLDMAQTMPSFVYLLPAVALFGATRFTAIVASIIYAVPPVVRLVSDGIRAVPATVVEAAISVGSTPRQLLWKVQLPVARQALLVATNQGIVMVLAMVVVGGLVGAGALGYDVVSGFAQSEDFGKGLAAGTAIVLLGVVLDRLTHGAGQGSLNEGKRL